jgi:hypothetical protein
VIPFDRDASTADALLTDLYLDAILAGRSIRGDAVGEIGGVGATASSAAPWGRLDPAIRAASERLRQDLVRVHPSFRFEERLATRLAEAAMELRMPTAVGAEGHLVPFRSQSGRPPAANPGSGEPVGVDGTLGDRSEIDRRDLARPLLIGGALTSAALSLAGAALVAWRRTRPGSPMSRAARAIRTASPAIARRGALRGPRRSSARPSARGLD